MRHLLIYCGFGAVLLFFPSWVLGVAPYGHKTVFRYRSYAGSHPHWVSPIDSVGGISHSTSDDIRAIDRGNGFEPFYYTDFNGVDEYIRSSSSISTLDSANHDSFTIQAWFMASNVQGYRCLVSNTQSYRGFSLKIKDGQLRGLMRLENNGSYINEEIIGGTISPGKWYYAAFRVKEDNDQYDMRLFINGVQVQERSGVPGFDGIRQCTEKPMVAAEPSSGTPSGGFFEGYIYAVSITNYAVDVENFLTSQTTRDGSRYFGMVSYHDYLDTTEGPDYRISSTINNYPDVADYIQQRYYCPYMNDKYVPQGLATDGRDRIYLTMYHKETDGTIGSYPSILVEMTTDGRLQRVMQLMLPNSSPYSGHVGGVAYWQGKIYIPRDGSRDVMRYDLAEASPYYFNPETFANPRGDQCPLFPDEVYQNCNLYNNSRSSYMSVSTDYDGTPILWTGQYTDKENEQLNLVGFAIDDNGDIVPSAPRYVYSLPRNKIQGAYCYESSPTCHKFYLAQSYGDTPSYIFDVRYCAGSNTAVDVAFTGPAGLEDLGMIGSDLWCVSESGAKYVQKRASGSWEELFPFVFSCKFSLKSDINNDGAVNTLDLRHLYSQWLGTPEEPSADIAGTWGDGIVNLQDFAQLVNEWLNSFSP